MSKWDDFKKNVGVIADKTVNKTRELTDTASLKLKIASKEADRDTEYKKLGKLTYSKLKNTDSKQSESLTRDISDTIEKLDTIFAELEALRLEEEERRAAKEAQKAEKTARREAEKQSEPQPKESSQKPDENSNEQIKISDEDLKEKVCAQNCETK